MPILYHFVLTTTENSYEILTQALQTRAHKTGATLMAKSILLPKLPTPLQILPQTYLTFISDEGDYIGQGKTMKISTTDYDFSLQKNSLDELQFKVDDGRSDWNINFKAPRGQILNVGHYAGAERTPFKRFKSPGFEFTGEHRGCNEIQAEFDILKLERDTNSNLIVFEVDFFQRCDSTTVALRGQLRFYSQSDGD